MSLAQSLDASVVRRVGGTTGRIAHHLAVRKCDRQKLAAGLPVAQVFPQSVGMAVGFSVVVNANFDRTKTSLERKIGKSIKKCEPPSDNMRTCELEIGAKKALLLMAEDNAKSTTTLFGCYYFYEK